MRTHPHIPMLARDFGLIIPGAQDFTTSQAGINARMLLDAAPTNALQSQAVTYGNAGIPAFYTNFMDPELVRVITTPTEFGAIFGETKRGDWTSKTWEIPMVESLGQASTYGDYDNNGLAGVNVNYENRQAYKFQIITRWGDEEMEMQGLAKVDWAAEQNIAAAKVFDKVFNKSYAFGTTGLMNYGWLNDPSLSTPITPTASWVTATGLQVVGDVQRLFTLLQQQLGGNISMKDKMILAMSPYSEAAMITPMSLVSGTASVQEYLKKVFPNLEVMTAVEYSTTAGNLVQLIAPTVQGQKVGTCGFTEKLRAHAVVRDTSSTHQKKSAGTWGAAVKLPAAIAQCLGV